MALTSKTREQLDVLQLVNTDRLDLLRSLLSDEVDNFEKTNTLKASSDAIKYNKAFITICTKKNVDVKLIKLFLRHPYVYPSTDENAAILNAYTHGNTSFAKEILKHSGFYPLMNMKNIMLKALEVDLVSLKPLCALLDTHQGMDINIGDGILLIRMAEYNVNWMNMEYFLTRYKPIIPNSIFTKKKKNNITEKLLENLMNYSMFSTDQIQQL